MTDSTPPPESSGPAVGQDEWVARHAEGRYFQGRLGSVEGRLRLVPW
jgi:hypothetical protein